MKLNHTFKIAVLMTIATASLPGQDWLTPKPAVPQKVQKATSSAVAHVGTSPFSPREELDTRFYVDAGGGLDTGCSYRSNGPLKITLPIKRVVGAVNGSGELIDPAGLVAKGLISAKAKIRLPAFDVDVNGSPNDPSIPAELDHLTINGHDVGELTGDNSIWKLNEFTIPIEWLKFPSAASGSDSPTPAENEIELHIDIASGSQENWCTSIDWVEIEFSAVAPIFLVHGTNAQSDSWEPTFTEFFAESNVPWSYDINLNKNGSILGNGNLLAARLDTLAANFGAKQCHLIAHSKGGLDIRAYLNTKYDPKKLKVLSVYTLGTPHHGTIISDIIAAKRAAVDPESSNADIDFLIYWDWWIFPTPQQPALGDQTTTSMATFNAMYPGVPAGIRFYNYGADADLNDNNEIESGEAAGLIPAKKASTGNAMYHAIGNTKSITVTEGTSLWGLNSFTSIEIGTSNSTFAKNDLVTSQDSAHSPNGTYLGSRNANHSTMKSTALAAEILKRIGTDYPNK